MGRIEEKLKEMGLALPTPPAKGGVYAPAKCFGDNLVYISGCGPSTDGTPITGKLGEAVTFMPEIPCSMFWPFSSVK